MTAGTTRWVGRREADRFARLLDGEDVPSASPDLHALVALTAELPRPRTTPDPAFVARLRDRLVEEAAALPARPTTHVEPAPERRLAARSTQPARAVVVRVPRGLVTTVLATVAGLAVLVGGLSSRALPGDRLYDVKLGIGQAQVRLAGGDLARGRALLHQVDHRIDEVSALVAAGDPSAADVDLALSHAADQLAEAQRVLLATDDGRPDPVALQALADATSQAKGRLDQLGPMLPTASEPSLKRVLDLLATGTSALSRQVQVCGDACRSVAGSLTGALGGSLTRPGGATTAVPGAGPPSASSRSGGHGLPRVTVPTAVPTAGGAGGADGGAGVPGGPGGGSAGTSGGGATVPGVTASLPGVGVTVPGVTVTTAPGGLPSVSVPPVGVTLGPITASVSTSGCVVGLGGLCLGG
jgi:hypothetical protein